MKTVHSSHTLHVATVGHGSHFFTCTQLRAVAQYAAPHPGSWYPGVSRVILSPALLASFSRGFAFFLGGARVSRFLPVFWGVKTCQNQHHCPWTERISLCQSYLCRPELPAAG